MWLIDKLRSYRSTAIVMEPHHEQALPRWHRESLRATSVAVLALFDLNDWLIGRTVPDSPAVWDTDRWPWLSNVEQHLPELRAEVQAYMAGAALPHVTEISGYELDSKEHDASIPVESGAWRTALLFANGTWVEETARHFPVTRACFQGVGRKANVGFSVLEPHSHIEAHAETNRGALRLQLPIVVPTGPGRCGLRVADTTMDWVEGQSIVFDLRREHEAWNETDGVRILLLAELEQPLPAPARWVNRATQHSYRWHPSYRKMTDRIARFGREHDAAAGGARTEHAPA